MNRIKKPITVRFFYIQAKDQYFDDFISNSLTFLNNKIRSRIINIRSRKYLIKVDPTSSIRGNNYYPVTVVKERNTWQVKASRSGGFTGVSVNQGIIGDPYFFFVIPDRKLLLGFTTGPSGSLKSVGKTMLEQFNNSRVDSIALNLIPKEKEFSTLNELPEYSSLHFKVDSSSITDVSEDAPKLIKDLSSAPYIEGNMQLSLDLDFNDSKNEEYSKEKIVEIVSYLSDHEGCTVLKIKGKNSKGESVSLDFANAFYNYKTEIENRKNYIDEESSSEVLETALTYFVNNISQ
ncbi:hypothetical protein [Saccharospirillum salsuginis]|uniref:Uncharacterized protein n=1 Tax=Saccharospirillum salsuginis TaxID=418750 RepID=A0A918NAW2_9GAMM|nr:hypothetical protein [Saccharospirillum salsuginis]GGX54523.1 hypothetical protein GCM10007392_22390 [Saccharospirillum salsuginis]